MTLNDEIQKRINKFLHIVGIDLSEALKDKLTKEHGKDTGFLQSSIRYEVEGNKLRIIMNETGKFVDLGTPPHMPPVEELEGWAERKLGDKKKAWALAMHIKKFGTRPYPFIRTTVAFDSKKIILNAAKEAFS